MIVGTGLSCSLLVSVSRRHEDVVPHDPDLGRVPDADANAVRQGVLIPRDACSKERFSDGLADDNAPALLLPLLDKPAHFSDHLQRAHRLPIVWVSWVLSRGRVNGHCLGELGAAAKCAVWT